MADSQQQQQQCFMKFASFGRGRGQPCYIYTNIYMSTIMEAVGEKQFWRGGLRCSFCVRSWTHTTSYTASNYLRVWCAVHAVSCGAWDPARRYRVSYIRFMLLAVLCVCFFYLVPGPEFWLLCIITTTSTTTTILPGSSDTVLWYFLIIFLFSYFINKCIPAFLLKAERPPLVVEARASLCLPKKAFPKWSRLAVWSRTTCVWDMELWLTELREVGSKVLLVHLPISLRASFWVLLVETRHDLSRGTVWCGARLFWKRLRRDWRQVWETTHDSHLTTGRREVHGTNELHLIRSWGSLVGTVCSSLLVTVRVVVLQLSARSSLNLSVQAFILFLREMRRPWFRKSERILQRVASTRRVYFQNKGKSA